MGARVPKVVLSRAPHRHAREPMTVSIPSQGPGPGADAGRAPATSGGEGAVRIRPAAVHDLRRIAEIEAACFSAPWTLSAFRSLIHRQTVHILVAERDSGSGAMERGGQEVPSDVLGYAVLWRAADEAELATLAVDPGFRGRGIAGSLLDHLIGVARADGVKSVFLEVRPSNEAALSLYRGRGFRELGVRRHYYDRPTEDAKVLRLRL